MTRSGLLATLLITATGTRCNVAALKKGGLIAKMKKPKGQNGGVGERWDTCALAGHVTPRSRVM